MRKLKLDVDTLKVETFRTTRADGGTGTVRALYTLAAQGCTTDDDSCRGTCGGNTCWDTDSCVGCNSYYCTDTVGFSEIDTCAATCPQPGCVASYNSPETCVASCTCGC